GGAFNLYEKDAGGRGQDALLPQSADRKFPTDWSRDGRYILYRQIDPQTRYDIWALPVFGERKPFAFLHTEANEAAAVLSPDGRWLAYSSDESGRYEVYVQSFPGGGTKRQISIGGGIGPHWHGDGKELYYHAPDGKLMAVPVTSGASLAVGAPVALFEFRASGNVIMPYYSVTRDGQRFLLSTIVETEAAAPLTVVINWTAEANRK
ncbi:MAG: PD40 domain-containing protein, partial [Pyrinomonadaceae bacterium]|nr:PD40 domain-containing protein [Pyrinomonadaceae bacterium]